MPKHNMSKGEEGVSINLLGFNFSLNHFFLGKRHEYELKTILHLNVHQAFIVELRLRGVFSSQSFGLALPSKLALASPPLACLQVEISRETFSARLPSRTFGSNWQIWGWPQLTTFPS